MVARKVLTTTERESQATPSWVASFIAQLSPFVAG